MAFEESVKAKDPALYSVQSRGANQPYTSDVSGGGGLLWLQLGQMADEMPEWNALYPNYRDKRLKVFARQEPMLASAIYSMKTRVQTLNYTLSGPPRAKKFTQELLRSPGFKDSLLITLGKVVDDFYTSDNGAFIELWRGGNPAKDAGNRPVLGFAHLDSRLCWRSFDPEFPVWYTNPITGAIHKLHTSRVLSISDNVQPQEVARNIGFCATSRILRLARMMRNTFIYRDEKVSGGFTRALGAIKGVNQKQFDEAKRATESDAAGKGYSVFRGIPFLFQPGMEPGMDIDIILKDLASIPDGFNFESDTTLYAYILAFVFGVDAREFWPATQSGATKADASVQNMKARGRGLGFLIETIEGLIRQCLPETVTFEYDYTDDEADEQAARIHKDEIANLVAAQNAGWITPQEGKALAIAKNILDASVLENLEIPIDSDTGETETEIESPEEPQDDESENGNGNNDSGDSDSGDDAEKPQVQSKALGYKAPLTDYRRSLRALTRGLWAGQLDLYDFVDGASIAINRNFTKAWADGAKQCGIRANELTDEEKTELQFEINTEISYLIPFGQAIQASSKANGGLLQPLLDRAETWLQGYTRVMNHAQVMACANQKLKWEYGDTIAHCDDCSAMEGRVYRGSTWNKYGVFPKSPSLQCTGIHCDCRLVPTDEPITPGRPPNLVGRKALV